MFLLFPYQMPCKSAIRHRYQYELVIKISDK